MRTLADRPTLRKQMQADLEVEANLGPTVSQILSQKIKQGRGKMAQPAKLSLPKTDNPKFSLQNTQKTRVVIICDLTLLQRNGRQRQKSRLEA